METENELQFLISMGFTEDQSLKALEVTGNKGLQTAVEWSLVIMCRLLSQEQGNIADEHVTAPPTVASPACSLSMSSFFPLQSKNSDFLIEEEEEVPLPQSLLYVRLVEDISYEPYTHEKHMLNVYIPEPPEKQQVPIGGLPVVLHVHGGGWLRGDRNAHFYGGPFMGRAFAQRGMVAVVISYRVKVSFPNPILDVINAVKWVLAYIEHYGGDPKKLFLSGHSAGGHLISLLGTHPEYFSSFPPNTIKGIMSISGIYNLEGPLSINPKDFRNILFRSYYVNSTFGTDPLVWKQSSPLFHIDQSLLQDVNIGGGGGEGGGETPPTPLPPSSHPLLNQFPPFCLFNASTDYGLEVDGQRFYEALIKKGVVVHYHSIPNTNHASITKSEEVANRCVEFIHSVINKGE